MLRVHSEFESPCAAFQVSHSYISEGPHNASCTLNNVVYARSYVVAFLNRTSNLTGAML